MMRIVLDSGPLGLSVHQSASASRDACRDWIVAHLKAGNELLVPEIVEYELRRELLRLNHAKALASLALFIEAIPDRRMLLTSSDLRLAAELWAKARQQGKPTADVHALDVDVILCAQVLNIVQQQPGLIIATTNTRHLSQFLDARDWATV
jgi:predicted nucleic acid-binding protein